MRRCQSRLGQLTPGSRLQVCDSSESTLSQCAEHLSHALSIPSATEAWSRRLVPHRAQATDQGDPEWPVDHRPGVLDRPGQGGTEARLRRPRWAQATARSDQETESRPRRLVPTGPRSLLAANLKAKSGGLVTEGRGTANPDQNGSPNSWLVTGPGHSSW